MSRETDRPEAAPDPGGPDVPGARAVRRTLGTQEYVEGVLAGDRAAVARAITLVESSAPADGAVRISPRPTGPTPRMSAKIGNKATTPPKSTANRSRAMAPNRIG